MNKRPQNKANNFPAPINKAPGILLNTVISGGMVFWWTLLLVLCFLDCS